MLSDNLRTENYVKVTNRGMISIPAWLRKKYNIKDGDRVGIFEDELGIRLIPILSIEEIRKISVDVKEMVNIIEKNRKQEMGLEK
jgi:AbrB family looped-hinge helix DNA binding protein